MKKLNATIGAFLFILVLLIGCAPTQGDVVPQGMGETNAAYTMAAILTQAAFQTLEAKLTEVSQTLTPNTPQISSSTLPPSASSSAASTPPAASSNAPCNWAGFVKDVTFPDNTAVVPGQVFTKTWRLQNIGSCEWTREYSLVYAGGPSMSVSNQVPLTQVVKPGDTMDISVDFTAPSTAGTYLSYWILSDPAGDQFGIGPQANGVIWVKIQVVDPSQVDTRLAYNMADNYCSADWFSSTSTLSCPSAVDVVNGSVYLVYDPTIEGGVQKDIPAIVLIPDNTEGGFVQGIYPAVQVSSGDHLTTTIGCVDGYQDCDVIFEIRARTENGTEILLGSWGQVLDSYNGEIDLPLDSLAGMSVQFILTVFNNGSPTDDRAFWLFPAVWHASQ